MRVLEAGLLIFIPCITFVDIRQVDLSRSDMQQLRLFAFLSPIELVVFGMVLKVVALMLNAIDGSDILRCCS